MGAAFAAGVSEGVSGRNKKYRETTVTVSEARETRIRGISPWFVI
jgi:hypothetical protein